MTYQLKETDDLLGPYQGVFVETIRYFTGFHTNKNKFCLYYEVEGQEPKHIGKIVNGHIEMMSGSVIRDYTTHDILAYEFDEKYFGTEEKLLQYVAAYMKAIL